MQTLSTITALEVRAPMGLATGSFLNSEQTLPQSVTVKSSFNTWVGC